LYWRNNTKIVGETTTVPCALHYTFIGENMKYLQNKYTNLYFNIIENRKATPLFNTYTENHHIIEHHTIKS